MGVKAFQNDLRKGMTLEDALIKHNLTLKEALDVVHKPITQPKRMKPYTKRNIYKNVGMHIRLRKDSCHLRKSINGKMHWGGAYDTLEDAEKVRDYLEKHGWNKIKVNQACKELGIKRRRR